MSYEGIEAKIRGMERKLLKVGDYRKLSRVKSVERLAGEIKLYSGYSKGIKELDEGHLHRGDIENKLGLELTEDFERIYNFVTDSRVRGYLENFIIRIEVHILKLILCKIYDKRDIEYKIPELRGRVREKLGIEVERVKGSGSVEDLLKNLRGTRYFEIVNRWKGQSLFKLEMELDLYYYRELIGLEGKNLRGKDREVIGEINREKMELTNISWLYRMKKYYNFEREEIRGYLIPIRKRLSAGELETLIASPTLSEFEKAVSHTYYGDMFKSEGVINIEHEVYARIMRMYKRVILSRGRDNIGQISYYMYLKGMEINNLTTVIEGVRYGIEPDKIMEYLYLEEEV